MFVLVAGMAHVLHPKRAMRRVIASFVGLLLLSECAATQDPHWWASVTAARQAATEKRTADAESQWRQALAEAERSGPDSWQVAYTLQERARFYASQRRNDETEQDLKRALAIHEKIAPGSPASARTLTDLAHLYHSEGRYSEAEPLYERALPIAEASFGPAHRNVEVIVYLLANLYANEGKYADAERLYKRLVVDTAIDHQALEDLALLYEAQGRYAEAEPLRQRLLESAEKTGSPREIAQNLQSDAALMRRMGRSAEAAEMEARALAIFPALPRTPTAKPRIIFDKVEILAVTPPQVQLINGGFARFEMTASVHYILQSADTAALQLSPVHFQSPGCVVGSASLLHAGPLQQITRGEGRQTVLIRWFAPRAPGSAKPDDQGSMTIRTALWSDQDSQHSRRLLPSSGQSRELCYELPAPKSGQSNE
jgi:tetratricopeptide (TPR) repeat protein